LVTSTTRKEPFFRLRVVSSFFALVGRDDEVLDEPPDDLIAVVAEDCACAPVPEEDRAIRRQGDECVGGLLDEALRKSGSTDLVRRVGHQVPP
jgi:hypothetical protein